MAFHEPPNTPGKKGSGTFPASQHEWTDVEIAGLVADLESVHGGELTAAALVGVGPRAVPFVRDFLLNGSPRSVYQPRQRAVEILGELGAKDALITYLLEEREIQDAVVRHAEDAVKSTAGRALACWKTEDVFAALWHVACRKNLPGVVEGLGEFRRPEISGYFVSALGDSGCRVEAREALRKLGEKARVTVLSAALTPQPSTEEESPSSRIRRREAVRLLAEWKLPVHDWEKVRPLLDEPDPEINVHAAEIALAIATGADRKAAVRRLIAGLEAGDGFLQLEADGILRRHYTQVRPSIDAEIAARCRKSAAERNADRVLRTLLAIREQEEKATGP